MKVSIAGIAFITVLSAAFSFADQAAKVRVLRDVPYVTDARHPRGTGKLDLYLPDGRANVPVVVSYYGGGLTAGDKAEQALVGQRCEKPGVAPDRDKRIWGTDRETWIDASPAHHFTARVPAMLVLYADGDDAWRRQQNVEAAAALKATGAARVEIAMLAARTHNSIWSRLAEPDDEAARRILQFVTSTAGLGSR